MCIRDRCYPCGRACQDPRRRRCAPGTPVRGVSRAVLRVRRGVRQGSERVRRAVGRARRMLTTTARRATGWGLGGDGWVVLAAAVAAWWAGVHYGWAELT